MKDSTLVAVSGFLPSLLKSVGIPLLLVSLTAACGKQDMDFSDLSDKPSKTASAEKAKRGSLAMAQQHFANGDYGNAEKFFRGAVEQNPKNVEAWLGLAATYDQLKKFKNSSRAYTIAIELKGYTPKILNNLGYHYILRGDYDKAQKVLYAAREKEPNNPFIQNNLRLLKARQESNS